MRGCMDEKLWNQTLEKSEQWARNLSEAVIEFEASAAGLIQLKI